MAQAATAYPLLAARTRTIPWYIWCFTAATLCSVVGGVWDISWHKSIGRDTFWTPAHILIYLCGLLAGFGSAVLILSRRPGGVTIWGFRGPLGAFLAAWGGIAMLSSAPFDDWWHNAYGLDVKVLSPPHVVLILGILAIRLGALFLVLQEMNNAAGQVLARLRMLLLLLGGVWLGAVIGVFLEVTSRNLQHTARFYMLVAPISVLVLSALCRACPWRWTATGAAAVMTFFVLAQLWILPLMPAEPLLGPVYSKVTHFIPNEFPVLVLIPAVLMDMLRARRWPDWLTGPAFLALLVAVQWPFAAFLNSPASRNWVFGTHYLPYFTPLTSDYARGVFTVIETEPQFWTRMGLAVIFCAVAARLGGNAGAWMARLRR